MEILRCLGHAFVDPRHLTSCDIMNFVLLAVGKKKNVPCKAFVHVVTVADLFWCFIVRRISFSQTVVLFTAAARIPLDISIAKRYFLKPGFSKLRPT